MGWPFLPVNPSCPTQSTPVLPTSDTITYNGTTLPCTGVNTCETLTVAFQKIDDKICGLQSGKIPYTGASQDANLGNYKLSATVLVATADQKEITNDTYIILASDNRKTLILNNPLGIVITINNTLDASFMCNFFNIGAGTITFEAGTAILSTPDGDTLLTDKSCRLIKILGNNNFKLIKP